MDIQSSKLTKMLLGVVMVLALVVIVLAIIIIPNWKKPLAPPLDLPTQTQEPVRPTATGQTPTGNESHGSPTEPSNPTEAGPTAMPTPEPVCGGPEVLLVLAVGTDSRGMSYLYGLGDVIRIVRADFVNRRISVLSLPRDLWVEVPGIEEYGITHGKLNQAYFWGTEGMGYYESPAHGAGLLALTLEHNFGLRVDNYLTVNMRTFAKIVDAVGGIYIYVPVEMDGRYENVTLGGKPLGELPKKMEYGYFKPGSYLMDGHTALTYARIRAMDNDFERQKRQYQVLMALRDRLLSPDVIDAIPDLIDAFRGNVLTDLSAEQISQLTCLGLMLEDEGIQLEALSEDMFEPGFSDEGFYILQADNAVMRDIISRFVDGSWPE